MVEEPQGDDGVFSRSLAGKGRKGRSLEETFVKSLASGSNDDCDRKPGRVRKETPSTGSHISRTLRGRVAVSEKAGVWRGGD